MGASAASEIPLLLSFLYLFSEAEAGRKPSLSGVKAVLVAGRSASEDTVRWGVWLGRHICQMITQVS